MLEKSVERHLVESVKDLGGETRKVKWIGRSNAPDRRIMIPHAGCAWVELKRPGKTATAAQTREHTRMRALGETVVVLDSIGAVDKFLYHFCAAGVSCF